MKNLLKILPMVALCLACSSDNGDYTPAEGSNIVFGASIETTRAVADITNVKDEGFKVWGGFGTTTVFNGTNITLGSNSTHDTGVEWTFNTYNFYAVYPNTVAATFIAPNTFAISNYNIKEKQNTDLLIASAAGHVYPDNGSAVGLYFTHALAQLEFVGKSSTSTAKPLLKNISIYGEGTPTTASYSNSQEWTLNSATTQAAPLFTDDNDEAGWELASTGTTVAGGIMVFPKPATRNVNVDLAVFNGSTTEIRTITIPATEWEAGNIYRYTFTIDPNNDISITLKIKKWNELDSSYNITF